MTGVGSIDANGFYTAPAATSSSQTATITATSTADNTKSGSSTVTISAIVEGATVTSVSVSPSSVSVSGGATQQFSATVTGTNSPSQSVTWSVSPAGSINSSGLLTAPAATGSAQTLTVTATSVLDNTKSGTATVTVAAIASGGQQDIRMNGVTPLIKMTETSAVAPYAYAESSSAGAYDNTANGAVSALGLSGDGNFRVKLGSNGSGMTNSRPMVGFKATKTIDAYSANSGNILAGNSYGMYFGTSDPSFTAVNNRAPVENDWLELRRTGTIIKAYISSDDRTTWTQIQQFQSVPAGTLYFQVQAQSNGTFTAPSGTGTWV
jgi:hypothetical protein